MLAALGNGNKARELSYAEICKEKVAVFLYMVFMEPLLYFYTLWLLMGTVLIIYKTSNDSRLTWAENVISQTLNKKIPVES